MIFISSLTRTLKESQTVMSFLLIIPVIPMFIENAGPMRTWMYAIPSFSQQRLITDILGGESHAIIHYILSGTASILFAFVVVWLTTRQFHKESFIFGRWANIRVKHRGWSGWPLDIINNNCQLSRPAPFLSANSLQIWIHNFTSIAGVLWDLCITSIL